MAEIKTKTLRLLEAPSEIAAARPANEPLRPGFPIFTMIGTIALLILAAITLVRNHLAGEPAASGAGEQKSAEVITEKTAEAPVAQPPSSAPQEPN